MPSLFEYMQFATGVYAASAKNYIDPPTGWTRTDSQSDKPSGFSAGCYVNGTEMVISYTGTNDVIDMANWGIGLGLPLAQIFDAVDYYFACKAAHPEVTSITFTGHSLGGGLASLMSVYFDKPATVFDEAPFQLAAVNPLVTNAVSIYMIAHGYEDSAFVDYFKTMGLVALTRESNVTNYYVDGEALNYPRYSFDTLVGSDNVLPMGNTTAAPVERHSMALMTALQYSTEHGNAFYDAVKKLPDLVTELLDEKLFATDSRDQRKEDLLRRLLRHQLGVKDAIQPDNMLNRFAADMNILAQPGGLTLSDGVDVRGTKIDYLHNVSKALIAFAMQMYYEDTANAKNKDKQLFTDLAAAGAGSGGIQFDMADVSTKFKTAFDHNEAINLNDAKGYQYFDEYLNGYVATFFKDTERSQINSFLPYLRDWYIQAGANGLVATDTLNRGAFMLGGTGADNLTGGSKADLLVGNAGDDTLAGGQGDDLLLGGQGLDTYQYATGDGLDTVLDTDGQGSIKIDNKTVSGGAQFGDARVHRDANGHLYTKVDRGLVIDGNIFVQDWQGGNLGIDMTGPQAQDNPVTTRTIVGDLAPIDQDPNSDGVQVSYDSLGNIMTGPGNPQPDRADILFGSAGNDRISGYGGNDNLHATQGGSDILDGGAGRDTIYAGAGNDLLIGGTEGDILSGGGGDDRLYANLQTSAGQAILDGNAQVGLVAWGDWLAGGSGDDTLIGSAAVDVLMGGGGTDLLIGGAGNDYLLGDTDWMATGPDWSVTWIENGAQYNQAAGTRFPQDAAADVIYAGEGNDVAQGGKGNDVIFGEGGRDWLYGEEGNDTLLGGAGKDLLVGDGGESPVDTVGHDYLDGGAEDDVIYGCYGDDIIIGGSGNDQLYGDAGQDVFIFNKGDGVDHVYDTRADKNVFRFGAGIDKDNIKLHLGSLALDLGDGDLIHINNEDQADANGFDRNDVFNSSSIAGFEFADGSTLGIAELLARGFDLDGTAGDDVILGTNTVDRINGLAGNDTLEGGAAGDTLNGGQGDDMLSGGSGGDTYVFSRGDGQDIIVEQGDAATIDILQFGADILQGDVAFRRTAAGDLEIAINDATDKVTIRDWYTENAAINRIERIVFGDGSVLVPAALDNLPITGTAGDDVITDIYGNADGNDILIGQDGNDAITASLGNDVLDGGLGNDVLDGGAGNDTLIGGGGQDTFVMGYGMGLDTLVDASADGGTLQLNGILTAADLTFVQQGNDMLVQIGAGSAGASDGLLIQNYYSNPQAVWTIQAGAGTSTMVQAEINNIANRTAIESAEKNFLMETKLNLINSYTAQGFAMQSDGTFYRQQLVYPNSAYAYNTVSSITTNITLYYDSGNTVILPSTQSTIQTWDMQYAPPVHDHFASVNVVNRVTEDAVVYADADIVQTGYGTQWLQMSWESTPVQTWNGNSTATNFYIYDQGFSSSPYATDLGALIGWELITTTQTNTLNSLTGTVTNILADPGSLQTSGPLPQAVAVTEEIIQYTRKIQNITLGDAGQTVYANSQTLVHGGNGDDTIYGAGFAYGGDGNDVIDGSTTQYGGNGNDVLSNGQLLDGGAGDDVLAGGSMLIGGMGNDTMDGGYGATMYLIDPQQSGVDIIGDSGDSEVGYKDWFYNSLGIADWQQGESNGGKYVIEGEFAAGPFTGRGGYYCYFTYDQIPAMQAQDPGLANYILSNPQSVTYIQPLPAFDRPAANDYAALQAAYDAGVIAMDTVEFAQGISLSDLNLSWGKTDDEVRNTLDISWNDGASQVRLVMPNADDPLGFGVEQVKFADGSLIGMQELIALAPASNWHLVGTDDVLRGGAGSDTYVFNPGDGNDRIEDVQGADMITFGPGITSKDVSITQQGADVLLSYSANDSVLIENFDLWGMNGPALFGSLTFADGSLISIASGDDYDGPGSYAIKWFDVQGAMVSEVWAYNDGAHSTITFNADGSYTEIGYFSDEEGYYTKTSDASENNYSKVFYADDGSWVGSETFITNADGSSSEIIRMLDGSYESSTWDASGNNSTRMQYAADGSLIRYDINTNDGLGNYSYAIYDGNGNILNEFWSHADGSWGQVNQDGSSTGTDFNADGSFRSYANDGQGNLTDIWSQADGSWGNDTFKADGSSSGTVHDSSLSYNNYTNDGHGTVRTDYYRGEYVVVTLPPIELPPGSSMPPSVLQDTILSFVMWKYTIALDDGAGSSTTTIYDANGVSLGDSWIKADGTYGSDTYNADGSHTSYSNDGAGNVITTNYDVDGARIGDSWGKADGSSGADIIDPVSGIKVSGTVNNPAKGYSNTYTRVLLADGSIETVVNYSYSDGSIYTTDTVKQADGSYQKIWSRSDGSSGTTNYISATGEKTGTFINPVKGFTEVFDNTMLANGDTEALVIYTYTDGSTYTTDTVKQADGSYQQSWSKSDGSSGTTNYVSATGEKIGTIINPAKGFTEVFDNTVLANGDTEALVTYTYTDGSTYTTDTVRQADGSYQQSWSKSDGSVGATNYIAATGEKVGTVANAGAAYTYTFDNTVLANGVTEAKVNRSYTDGSTYFTDTITNPDKSYTQIWNKSDGSSGSKVVDGSGTLVADSMVKTDGTQIVDAGSNHLWLGTATANSIKASSNEILIGGAGNDTLTTALGTDIIAFNKGDGNDKVYAAAGSNNVLSLGGSFAYVDLALQKNGNDLVLDVGATDSITFKGWYSSTANRNIVDLQVIASAMSDFNPGSTDVLRNSNVEDFDFQQLVAAFDSARASNPALTQWSLTNSLLDAHLASSDTAALGGDLAFEYGMRGNLTGMNVAAAQSTLSDSQFGAAPQTLNPWPALNTGTAQIR